MVRLLVAVLLAVSLPAAAVNVEVRGLFSGRAVLAIDGQMVMLRQGDSRLGVRLVSADSRKAVLEIDGQLHELGVSRRISSSFSSASQAEVRLQSGSGGHYVTPARINGMPVEAMIDTGATAVAMSLPQARALGLDYRNGRPMQVSTANGMATSYLVTLEHVIVGGLRVDNVEALVNMSDFPKIILLGNSFLSRVNMFRENGVLVLQSQY